MCRIDPYIRLSAHENGETKCVIFVDSIEKARSQLGKYCSTIVGAYPFINGFGAYVSVHKLEDLSSLACVKAIAGHSIVTTTMMHPATRAISSVNSYKEYNGKGITVAVIDTGCRSHMDFCVPTNRLMFLDLVNGQKTPYDDNGHGTAVASILGGNGLVSGGIYKGVAPMVNLLCIKAIGEAGQAGAFTILEAMQYIYDNCERLNIRVVCMSFGSEPINEGVDPLSLGAEALYRRGIAVVASAGNDGPKSQSIKTPGVNPNIITVGGASIDADGITIPDFSSRGPCNGYIKPDITAQAIDVASCGISQDYTHFTGTSMAAPIVAGAVALMLQKNALLTPSRVKELLLSNAINLPFDKNISGYGLLCLDFIDEL